ncbi:SgcJ/EcaC family oxidoreductase [Saccharopolyspora sp. NPDC000359]|uniref:SgcJ/EcaC family oxidoreductase n=1 Tax=Saccharopolyspora sp. NPDC000359 TaxID=3154251 RepID=UPI003322224A
MRDLVNRYVAAWNAGDGRAFGAAYAPEATHVTFDGALLRGRDEIAGVHSQLFDTFLRGSRIELQVEELRLVTDEVAVLHTSGGILEAGDAARVA